LGEKHKLREVENRVLWKICGPKRDEAIGKWRLYNEELYDLNSAPYIGCVVILRRMRWARHVTRKGDMRGAHRLLVGIPEGKRPLGRPSVEERAILKWIFKRYDWEALTGLIWLRIGIGRRALVNVVMKFRIP
jgi:hypothetical protein